MPIEYILLSIVFILPSIYKLIKWARIFQMTENQDKKILQIFSSHRDFWLYLEVPLFLFGGTLYFNPLFEIFVFNIFLYFGILYSVFVLGKIFRKKLLFPKWGKDIVLGIIFSACILGGGLYFLNNMYIVLMGWMIFCPIVFFIFQKWKK